MKLDRLQEGKMCHLVFKVQSFVPTPNPRTQTMDMRLNILSGKYHGKIEGDKESFLFETGIEGSNESMMWEVDIDDVLMAGTKTDVSDISRS